MQFIAVLSSIDNARYPKGRIFVRMNEYVHVFSIVLHDLFICSRGKPNKVKRSARKNKINSAAD